MGYSTGGDVALLLQARNPMVDLVVGLDPSWALGSDNDVRDSPFLDPDRHHVPIAVLRRPRDPEADALLRRLDRVPRLVAEVPGGDHGTFSDDTVQRHLLGIGPSEAAARHRQVVRAVAEILEVVLVNGEALDGAGLTARLWDQGLEVATRPRRRR